MPKNKGDTQIQLEYLFFQIMRGVITALPMKWALAWGRFMGGVLYCLDGRHRIQAKKNIARAMQISEDGPEAGRIARAAYRHLGQVAVEFVLIPKVFEEEERGRSIMELEGKEKVEKALSRGKGLIFVTGHTGNWELMGSYVSRYLVPMWSVAREFRNPRLEQFIRRRREMYRQRIIPKMGALLKSSRILKEGGAVAFLMDQYAGSSEPKLDFLGIPAHTFSTPGALAVRFKAPVMAGFCYRVGNGFRYKGYFEDPIVPKDGVDPSEEVLRITESANQAISRYIRSHPTQWLWMHRRWR